MSDKILTELETIRNAHGGVLYPKDVVEFAEDPGTALHSRFTWDDTKAAAEYRLWQARQIIRVSVMILPRDDTKVQAYVSLLHDRKGPDPNRGYRNICDVMATPVLRKTLLQEALDELERVEEKYKGLKELAEVFAAARTARQKKELTPVPVTA